MIRYGEASGQNPRLAVLGKNGNEAGMETAADGNK
jgi:hypothetical protein